nr:biotin transporter BioY [Orenia metallireducens]
MVVKIKTKDLILAALFAALTAVGAFIKIPIPYVPFTLQVLFVFFAGSLLGSRLALISQLVYLGIGLIGIPIFTQGGGPSYILQPTFGYLLGFAIGAYVIGKIIENLTHKTFINFLLANFIGLTVVYLFGVVYLYLNLNFITGTTISLSKAIKIGFLLPIPGDLLLCIIAALISKKVITQVRGALPIYED